MTLILVTVFLRPCTGLSSNDCPGRFTHSPALVRIGGVRFPFLMRWKPEDAIVWGERARPETIGAFHQLNATLQKTLWFDLYDTWKGAFECLRRLYPISDKIAGYCTLNPFFAACAN